MRKTVLLYAGWMLSVRAMFGQSQPQKKEAGKKRNGVVFKYAEENQTKPKWK
jgi:hypothetical protein